MKPIVLNKVSFKKKTTKKEIKEYKQQPFVDLQLIHPLVASQSRNISHCSFFTNNDTLLFSFENGMPETATGIFLDFALLDEF